MPKAERDDATTAAMAAGGRVRCIKEWHSRVYPAIDYGILGYAYDVIERLPETGLLRLAGNGIADEYVRAERFEAI